MRYTSPRDYNWNRIIGLLFLLALIVVLYLMLVYAMGPA